MDAVALAKFQFAFTVAYHFFFVPLSIGLGLVTVLFERAYYKSGKEEDKAMSTLWIKIFAATFAIGVATGITMEFAFGTNWASYSRFVGDIFGAPLAAEGLFAFFLESTFLGVLLFGRNKVSKKFYYVSTWLVWLGSLLSALWIIIANSWMQTPRGYEVQIVDGVRKAVMTNFFAAGFNPSTWPRYFHTVNSLIITGGMMAAAVGAYHLLKGEHKDFGRRSISYGLIIALIGSIAMGLTGHFQAVEVVQQQPVKMAAMEGHWDTGPMPLGLVGWVDTVNKKTVAIEIPGGVSFLESFTFTKPLPGLNDFSADLHPPLQATYQTYHLMIVVFLLLIVVTAYFWWINRTGKLEEKRGLLKFLMWAWLLPEIGIQMGWAAAEIGRQPWIVTPPIDKFPDPAWGLKTVDAVSKVVPAYQIALTIAIFFVIYALLFVGWARVVLNIIKKGPQTAAASTKTAE
ncbi:MAG: cytochrome ubiquinol oxidase subunit I [Coriobacteriia bacterium]|nr:cytochrome ubiquinol oxidase subunit I [Coriobacteriia bacterium]